MARMKTWMATPVVRGAGMDSCATRGMGVYAEATCDASWGIRAVSGTS
jgi:hypothetical protein